MKLERKERVIIVGCGRLGSRLATLLSDKNYQVIIIDDNAEAFNKLPETFGGVQVNANGIDIESLKYVDIAEAEMLVACTGNDNINNLIAQIASRIFKVPNVYVRFEDTDKELLISGFNIEGIYPFKLTMGVFEDTLFGNGEEDEEK